MAANNDRVQEALAPSTFPGLAPGASSRSDRREFTTGSYEDARDVAFPMTSSPMPTTALVQHLDDLAQDIVATPGAGGALLAAYAAQARALSMVVEAARRAGASPLPTAVLLAAQEALAAPSPLPGLAIG